MLYQELGHRLGRRRWSPRSTTGELRSLKGFAAKTEENIARGHPSAELVRRRVLVSVALEVAEDLLERFRRSTGVRRVAYAGSLRRMAETIGDVDLLVALDGSRTGHGGVRRAPTWSTRVIARGDTKTSILTRNGPPGRPPRGPPRGLGRRDDLLHRLEGPQHPDPRDGGAQGPEAQRVRPVSRPTSGDLLAAETEEEVYERARPAVHPAHPARGPRRDRGRAGRRAAGPDHAAADPRRPAHPHEPHRRARDPGARWWRPRPNTGTPTTPSPTTRPNLAMQRMTDAKILAQRVQVAKLQSQLPEDAPAPRHRAQHRPPTVRSTGTRSSSSGFDLTVASVHSHFNQSRGRDDARVIRAIENPFVNVIGHLTGRKIGRRAPIDLDLEAVFEAAGSHGHGARDQRLSRPARPAGRAHPVGTPARREVLDRHRLARAGASRRSCGSVSRPLNADGSSKDDVINAWPIGKLERFLRKGRPKAAAR